jgi:hypothetical protein
MFDDWMERWKWIPFELGKNLPDKEESKQRKKTTLSKAVNQLHGSIDMPEDKVASAQDAHWPKLVYYIFILT